MLWLLSLLLFTQIIASIAGSVTSNTLDATGVAIITQEYNWNYQLHLIRYGQITSVRLPITKGFGNTPSMVDDLVEAGVTTIVYQSRDCSVEYENVYRDLVDQAFQMKILEHPEIQFYIEVGNEPDICGRDPTDYASTAVATTERLRGLLQTYPNVRFVLSLGVDVGYNRLLLEDSRIVATFDALAFHIYGHENLWDAGEGWSFWNNELSTTGLPILLTEVGINGNIGQLTKAQRYHEFTHYVRDHRPETVLILFWTVTPHPYWPQYHLTPPMVSMLQDGTVRRWR